MPSLHRQMGRQRKLTRLMNFLSGFKKLGWKALAAVATVLGILLKMVILPGAASNAVSTFAEGHGVEMTVDGWSGKLSDLSAVAEGVTLYASGPFAQKEILVAEAIELDLSLWGGLFGDSWITGVKVREPKLYVERLPAGRWNWEDLASLRVAPDLSATSGSGPDVQPGTVLASKTATSSGGDESGFQLKKLELTEMKLEWVENLPGSSGGGLIQDVKATLFVDDIEMSVSDLKGLIDSRQAPSRVSFNARTGDGKIDFDGDANLFRWLVAMAGSRAQGAGLDRSTAAVWAPTLDATLYLENVGAGAFARLTPDAAIVPQRGSMSGDVKLQIYNREVICSASLRLDDVTFAVNPRSPFTTGRVDELESQLANYRVSGQRQFDCGGLLAAESYRPFQAFQTNVVRKGVDQAPRTVQVAAAAEHAKYSNQPVEEEYRSEVERWLDSLDPETREWLKLGAGAAGVAGRRGAPGPRLPAGLPNPFGT